MTESSAASERSELLPAADLELLTPRVRELVSRASHNTDQAEAVFAVLAHHPDVLERWLRFAGHLLMRGDLGRRDAELLVLRTARNCACDYEWNHHEAMARELGIDDAELDRVRSDDVDDNWSPRNRLLLVVVDELHVDRCISAETWRDLAVEFSPRERIEICMLVGAYEMLAMLIKSAGVTAEH